MRQSARICTTAALLLGLASCQLPPRETTVVTVQTSTPWIAEWPLKHTGTSVQVRIDSIVYLRGTDFAIEHEGAKTAYVAGLRPTIYFSLSNTGRRPVLVPISDEQYITSTSITGHTEASVYLPRLDCFAVQTSEITDTAGHLVRTHSEGRVNNLPCVRLRPGQTRIFRTSMTFQSLPAQLSEYVFLGFPFNDPATGSRRAIAFTIRTDTRTIIGQQQVPLEVSKIIHQ